MVPKSSCALHFAMDSLFSTMASASAGELDWTRLVVSELGAIFHWQFGAPWQQKGRRQERGPWACTQARRQERGPWASIQGRGRFWGRGQQKGRRQERGPWARTQAREQERGPLVSIQGCGRFWGRRQQKGRRQGGGPRGTRGGLRLLRRDVNLLWLPAPYWGPHQSTLTIITKVFLKNKKPPETFAKHFLCVKK